MASSERLVAEHVEQGVWPWPHCPAKWFPGKNVRGVLCSLFVAQARVSQWHRSVGEGRTLKPRAIRPKLARFSIGTDLDRTTRQSI